MAKSKKKVFILIVVGIIVILTIVLLYKIYMINKYSIRDFKIPNVDIKEPITISNKKIDDIDYFRVNNIMIQNDFEEFKEISDNNGFKMYGLYDENNKLKAGINFFEYVTFTDGLSKEVSVLAGDGSKIKGEDISSFMKSHNFKNDFEFIKYLSSLKEEKASIFTSIKKMEDNYVAYYLAKSLLTDGSYKEILGDYTGYLLETDNDTAEVNIVTSDKKYIITFYKLDYFTEDYIKELIASIKILT